MVTEDVIQLLTFQVDQRTFALLVGEVERVLPAMEPVRFPKAPEIVVGIINIAGDALPLIDVRLRLGLAVREMEPEDRIILARGAFRRVGLLVDGVGDVISVRRQRIKGATGVVPGLDYVRGIVALEDGLLLISDLDAFLSLEEAARLDRALEESRP